MLVKVRAKVGINAISKFEDDIDEILKSITFKKLPTVEKNIIKVETTEQELTNDWVNQKMPLPGPNGAIEIPKLDSLLLDLYKPNFSIKLRDTNTEIKNWSDFFTWKPNTLLKDYELFAFQKDSPGKKLEILRMHIHLGDYDQLYIEEIANNQLEFTFSKMNGNSIAWILTYDETHDLPLNKKIELHRFLYTTTNTYLNKKNGKRAYHIPFLINDKVYRMKVENLSVF